MAVLVALVKQETPDRIISVASTVVALVMAVLVWAWLAQVDVSRRPVAPAVIMVALVRPQWTPV